MKSICLLIIFLLVCVFSTGVFADHKWDNQIGYWSETAKWTGDGIPDGTSKVKIYGSDAACTLNTDESAWELSDQGMDVYDNATLIIEENGVVKPARFQVGYNTPGHVIQTGGLVSVYKDKLYVGGQAPGTAGSSYLISGGTLTNFESDGYLYVGRDGSSGTFTVVGSEATIQMRKCYIGAHSDGSAFGAGTVEFRIDSTGVSPIQMTDNVYLDMGGDDSTADLIISLLEAPPTEDILLFEDMSGGSLYGTFDTVNGISAVEGASVLMNFGGVDYAYELTYAGNGTGDSNNNDVMLMFVPEPMTLVLLGLGGLIAIRKKR